MSLSAITQYGLNMHFGLGATVITITNVTGQYQGIDYKQNIEKAEDTDQRGGIVTATYFNQLEKATFTYKASDAQSPAGNAVMTAPALASNFAVTADWSPSGSLWKCDSVSYSATKDKNTEITVEATRYSGF